MTTEATDDRRWRGIEARVSPRPDDPAEFRVRIWPDSGFAIPNPGGHPRAPVFARISVRADPDPRVIEARFPDPTPSALVFTRYDYEARAVELVRRHLGRDQPTSAR